jgi:hypothetical protein
MFNFTSEEITKYKKIAYAVLAGLVIQGAIIFSAYSSGYRSAARQMECDGGTHIQNPYGK